MRIDTCRSEYIFLFVGVTILLVPYIFYHTETKSSSEGSTLILPHLPTRNSTFISNFTHDFTDLSWSNLTWRPTATSRCLPSYRWTPNVQELQCSQMNSSKKGLCGGVLMAGCASYVTGEFISAKPSDVKPSRLYAPIPTTTPFCSTESSIIKGKYLFDTKSFHEDNVYAPVNCSLVPLDLNSLAQASRIAGKQSGKINNIGPIVLIGDSHIRNLFAGFVAGLRQQEYFLETHDTIFKEEHGVLIYRVERITGKIFDHRGAVLLASESVASLHDGIACSPKADLCLQVLFFWAANFGDQARVFPVIKTLHPALVVISPGNVYEPRSAFPESYARNLTDLARSLPNAKIHFNTWPWGHFMDPDRERAIDAWRDNLKTTKVHRLSHSTFGEYGGVQGRATYHYACTGRHNRAGMLLGIEAFENCTDVVDTAMARVLLTLALY